MSPLAPLSATTAVVGERASTSSTDRRPAPGAFSRARPARSRARRGGVDGGVGGGVGASSSLSRSRRPVARSTPHARAREPGVSKQGSSSSQRRIWSGSSGSSRDWSRRVVARYRNRARVRDGRGVARMKTKTTCAFVSVTSSLTFYGNRRRRRRTRAMGRRRRRGRFRRRRRRSGGFRSAAGLGDRISGLAPPCRRRR